MKFSALSKLRSDEVATCACRASPGPGLRAWPTSVHGEPPVSSVVVRLAVGSGTPPAQEIQAALLRLRTEFGLPACRRPCRTVTATSASVRGPDKLRAPKSGPMTAPLSFCASAVKPPPSDGGFTPALTPGKPRNTQPVNGSRAAARLVALHSNESSGRLRAGIDSRWPGWGNFNDRAGGRGGGIWLRPGGAQCQAADGFAVSPGQRRYLALAGAGRQQRGDGGSSIWFDEKAGLECSIRVADVLAREQKASQPVAPWQKLSLITRLSQSQSAMEQLRLKTVIRLGVWHGAWL